MSNSNIVHQQTPQDTEPEADNDWKSVELTLLGYGLPPRVVFAISGDAEIIQELLIFVRQSSARAEQLEGIVIETKRQRDELAETLKANETSVSKQLEEKEQQIESLQNAVALAELNGDCEFTFELRNEKKNLEQQVEELKSKIEAFDQSANEAEYLNEKLARAEVKIADLEKQVGEAGRERDKAVSQVREEMATLETRLLSDKAQLEATLAGKVVDLIQERAKSEELQNRLLASVNEAAQIDRLQAEIRQLKEELSDERSNVQAALTQNREAFLDWKSKRDAKDLATRHTSTEKDATVSEQKKRIIALNNTLSAAKEQNMRDLKNFSAWQKDKYQPLKEKLQHLTEQLSATEKERDELLRLTIPKLCVDNETQTSNVSHSHPDANKRKRVRIDASSHSESGETPAQEIVRLKAKLSNAVKERQEVQEKNKHWFKWKMENYEPMKADYEKLQQKLRDSQNECQQLRSRIKTPKQIPVENKNKNLTTSVNHDQQPLLDGKETEQLRNHIHTLVTLIGQLKEENSQLQTRVSAQTEYIEQRNQRLHTMNQMFIDRLEDYERQLREQTVDNRRRSEHNFLCEIIRVIGDGSRDDDERRSATPTTMATENLAKNSAINNAGLAVLPKR